MTALRHRMLEDLQLRGRSARTQEMSVRAVRPWAEHDHTSPDRITEEKLRQAFLSRKHVTHYSRRASPMALCGITCFSEHPRKRAWTPLPGVRAPRAKTLPGIRSVAAVRTMLAHVQLLRSRVWRTTRYAGGRRLPEGPRRPSDDLDRARWLVHVRQATGAKDRSVPLPLRTLEWRRPYGATPRHPIWMLPAPGRGGRGMPTATVPMPRRRVQAAFHAA